MPHCCQKCNCALLCAILVVTNLRVRYFRYVYTSYPGIHVHMTVQFIRHMFKNTVLAGRFTEILTSKNPKYTMYCSIWSQQGAHYSVDAFIEIIEMVWSLYNHDCWSKILPPYSWVTNTYLNARKYHKIWLNSVRNNTNSPTVTLFQFDSFGAILNSSRFVY